MTTFTMTTDLWLRDHRVSDVGRGTRGRYGKLCVDQVWRGWMSFGDNLPCTLCGENRSGLGSCFFRRHSDWLTAVPNPIDLILEPTRRSRKLAIISTKFNITPLRFPVLIPTPIPDPCPALTYSTRHVKLIITKSEPPRDTISTISLQPQSPSP